MKYDSEYTNYQANRSALRKWVRKFYLRSASSVLQGRTLDFGCGIGELLETLDVRSVGLEYNQDTVTYCRDKGLDVRWYNGFDDDWRLSVLEEDERFESMVVSHVLEHFDNPDVVLKGLLRAAERFHCQRLLVIVPGHAGYRSDPTHRTYIDETSLAAMLDGSSWEMEWHRRFPINYPKIGEYFAHHELQALIVPVS